MSRRVDELKSKTQIKLHEEEIKMYEKELNTIPWYTFNKEKRIYRSQLKDGIKACKILISMCR